MNIVFASEGLGSVTPRAVWALGTFDGVHRGHVALLRAAQRQAREKGLPAGAFTFDVNPIEVLAPQRRPLYLVSLQRKLELFEEAGVDQVVVRRFEPEFAACSPQEFARAVLAEQLGAEHVVVGYDYTFGRMGQG
ncbi:MAG: bifunctional riboflavin kinase/FAD synthetase, partial [Bacillota bacterium]